MDNQFTLRKLLTCKGLHGVATRDLPAWMGASFWPLLSFEQFSARTPAEAATAQGRNSISGRQDLGSYPYYVNAATSVTRGPTDWVSTDAS